MDSLRLNLSNTLVTEPLESKTDITIILGRPWPGITIKSFERELKEDWNFFDSSKVVILSFLINSTRLI